MPNYKQAGRLMQFASSLGPDELLIESLEGVEGLSRLFDFQVELYAASGTEIDPNAIIGTKVTVTMAMLDVQGMRFINGLVAAFEQTSGDGEFDVYRAYLVPSLWQLTLSSNCRVFQNVTVMDIIKAVISPYGLSVSDVTKGSYKPVDYCTQYDESDFNFVSRLAEQFGIFYWFEHKNGDNTVCFGDDRSAYSPCPLVSAVTYAPQGSDREDMYHSVVSDLRVTAAMVTGKHSMRDFDYRPFGDVAQGPDESSHPNGKNAFERYSYPTGESGFVKLMDKQVSSPNHGQAMLTAQRDASDVSANIFHGTSTARSFLPGFTFELSHHPRKPWNRAYVLTEVSHFAVQAPPYRSDTAVNTPYTNRFRAIESDRVFRPLAVTPRPRIPGPQPAMVITPAGEDLYLDKLGRVCVRFMWDRERTKDGVDNTWVRVAQPWAGNGWGTYFWPRVGDEVLVQFLDGNPDNPVVIGSIYNGVNVPKYALPDMGTRTGILTRSSKGGSASNANELRFEDKKGSEQIFINAEHDMDVNVENDNRRNVAAKDSLVVGKDRLEAIKSNSHSHVTMDRREKVDGKVSLTVGSDMMEKIGGDVSLNVTGSLAEQVGKSHSMDASSNIYLKAGQNLVLEAGMMMTLKAGGAFITLGPSGVAISGTMVMINSGGSAGSGTAGTITDPVVPTEPDQADDGTKGGAMAGSLL